MVLNSIRPNVEPQVLITFTDDDSYTVSNFIAKYEEHINMTILRHESDGFVFNIEASSQKEIARICDIMLEDIDVTFWKFSRLGGIATMDKLDYNIDKIMDAIPDDLVVQ